MTPTFYHICLVDRETGEQIATETIWATDMQIVSLEQIALEAAGYFEGEPHHEDPTGRNIKIYGPFRLDHEPQVYAIEEQTAKLVDHHEPNLTASNEELLDQALANPPLSHQAGQVLEQAYLWGYRSEDKEP